MINWTKPQTEEFIEKHQDLVNWFDISIYQELTEEFIEKHSNEISWDYISIYQKLTEEFIEKHSNKVDWYYISKYQKLTEKFIEKHSKEISWYYISTYQKLTEEFIEKHSNKVDWNLISIYQKLTEEFIEKHSNEISWDHISKYQKLTEKFIEKHSNKVNWNLISIYQKLTEKFIEKHGLTVPKDNWFYKSTNDKLSYIKENTNYEVIDNEYIIAYKTIRSDNYSVFNFQYKYEVGKVYTSHCDCNLSNENSFGLSVWTEEGALDYHSIGKLLKVKVNIEDIGAIVHNNNKIRCFKLEVLEEV